MINPGKSFETDFIKSVPDTWFKYRLNDSGGAWQGGDKARFTPSNICDFIVYNGKLWLLELKSHKGTSIPFTCIREKQVIGLLEAYKKGTQAGYIFNFRDTKETFYINANLINSFMLTAERKSIPLLWIKEVGTLIPQTKKISHFKYDLDFMGGI